MEQLEHDALTADYPTYFDKYKTILSVVWLYCSFDQSRVTMNWDELVRLNYDNLNDGYLEHVMLTVAELYSMDPEEFYARCELNVSNMSYLHRGNIINDEFFFPTEKALKNNNDLVRFTVELTTFIVGSYLRGLEFEQLLQTPEETEPEADYVQAARAA